MLPSVPISVMKQNTGQRDNDVPQGQLQHQEKQYLPLQRLSQRTCRSPETSCLLSLVSSARKIKGGALDWTGKKVHLRQKLD